jgi:osmotically inducible protein OsmC
MPRIVREASVTWKGSMARGSGALAADTSGAFSGLPYSFPTRIGNPEGRTSPEELLAAAHAGCFAMSLANELGAAGVAVESVATRCTITMDEVEGRGHLIVASAIGYDATGEGLDEALLDATAAQAHEGCSFSTLLRDAGATVEIARLAG